MDVLNQQDRYHCVYANIEGAQAARGDETKGIPAICSVLVRSIELYLDDNSIQDWYRSEGHTLAVHSQLSTLLTVWASQSSKPIVLFLDEVDALVGDTLISLLRQIREGYAQRPQAFPQSIILCGVRDVRDYRIQSADKEIITGGSAFNIKAESLRMGNFSQEEVKQLWLQHTQETGQTFDPLIFDELWTDTQGQPWLVNALGYELTWKNKAARDRSLSLSLEDYKTAREKLIYSRQTHLDQLVDKLREPRVYRVMSALLSGEEEGSAPEDIIQPDDQQYVEDLGLITSRPSIKISNRIYQEVIPRELTWVSQTRIPNQEQAWYIKLDNSLDMHKLLESFQQFYRENSEIWLERFDYKEAAPQLLMQAFLQRIINGGGRISREYGLGRKRTDLFIEWPLDSEQGFFGPVQRVVIELKIQRGSKDSVVQKGLEQTADYSAHVGAEESHLVIFNRTPDIDWSDKIWQQEENYQGQIINIWGV